MASMQKLSGPLGATFEVVDTAGVCTIELDGSALVSVAGTDLSTLSATAAELNMAADNSANTEIVTTTNLITAAESGKTFILNSTTGFVSTLPAVAAGLRFTFIIGAAGVANAQNHTVIVPAGANLMFGMGLVAGAHVGCSAQDTVNFVGTSGTTALPGDKLEVFSDGTNWYVLGFGAVAGSITFTGG